MKANNEVLIYLQKLQDYSSIVEEVLKRDGEIKVVTVLCFDF